MASASKEDAQNIKKQLDQLTNKWEQVWKLTDVKHDKLEGALKQAEELHRKVHILLEWLSDAEMKLRFAGPLPEDEVATLDQINDHKQFMMEMAAKEGEKNATIALAREILKKCHPDALPVIKHWITIIESRWEEVSSWARQRQQRLDDHVATIRDLDSLLEELLAWLTRCEDDLLRKEAEDLPEEVEAIEDLIKEHEEFMEGLTKRQPEVESVTKTKKPQVRQPTKDGKGRATPDSHPGRRTPVTTGKGPKTSTPAKVPVSSTEPQIKNPRARELFDKWRRVWLLAMERQRRLQERLAHVQELEKMKNFNFEDWRKRYVRWANQKKLRIGDYLRRMDKDADGKLTREELIDGILKSKFPTSRMEMERVCDLFDKGDGLIDVNELITALKVGQERPATDDEQIRDEVQRQIMKCTCAHRFKVHQVGEGKYRFGESQKLRLVRILRSTVMVRVGGGWVSLDEFLVKNDPCRAKGRTNIELREQFILATGVSQSMQAFKSKSPGASSQSSSQTGTSRSGPNQFPATGPITKIREKSARSVPMSKQSNSDLSGSNLLTPPGMLMGRGTAGSRPGSRPPSRPSSRPPSRPSSRPNSRPPSRAGSDLSIDSTDGCPTTPRLGRRSGSTLQRQASNASQSSLSGRRGGSTTPSSTQSTGAGTRIPTVKRTPSSSSSSGRPTPGRTADVKTKGK